MIAPEMEGFPEGLVGHTPIKLIRRGATALVFKARQQSTGRFTAVKSPHVNGASEVYQRFRRELRLWAALTHPRIACLIEVGQTESGRPYAISEFAPGETLRQFLIRQGPLDLRMAFALTGQLLEALAFLHARGIIHRDLKPQNVVVARVGTRAVIKLIDFGMAARSQSDGDAAPPAGGTPSYCAPEQLRGEPPTPAADLYAWGLIFVECLCGGQALPGLGYAALLHAQLNPEPVPLPPQLRGHLLGPLLREVLCKDPVRRASDAATLHFRLRRLLVTANHPPPLAPATRRGR